MQRSFGEKIIHWYHLNKRDLPWRNTRDPYKIWLSEIILQQTRVDQGLDYYTKFISKYPDVGKLACAKENDVLKLWQGLGYYSRARNLHYSAKDILKRFHGKFPSGFEDIRSLKGIGDYTAGAISSFAYNEKHPAVDGNVYRVMSRYLGISTPVNSSAAKKEFNESVLELMTVHPPGDFNQALIEFGSLHCKPQNPLCVSCPLNGSCFAFGKKMVSSFPVKGRKAIIRTRYFNYLLITSGKTVQLRKRTGADIWKNLYDFPMIETPKKMSAGNLLKLKEWKSHFSKTGFRLLSESKTVKHQLTHQTIYAKFFEVSVSPGIKIAGAKAVHRSRIDRYALPKLIENYLNVLLK